MTLLLKHIEMITRQSQAAAGTGGHESQHLCLENWLRRNLNVKYSQSRSIADQARSNLNLSKKGNPVSTKLVEECLRIAAASMEDSCLLVDLNSSSSSDLWLSQADDATASVTSCSSGGSSSTLLSSSTSSFGGSSSLLVTSSPCSPVKTIQPLRRTQSLPKSFGIGGGGSEKNQDQLEIFGNDSNSNIRPSMLSPASRKNSKLGIHRTTSEKIVAPPPLQPLPQQPNELQPTTPEASPRRRWKPTQPRRCKSLEIDDIRRPQVAATAASPSISHTRGRSKLDLSIVGNVVFALYDKERENRRQKRRYMKLRVRFPDESDSQPKQPLEHVQEFDPDNSSLSVNDPTHQGEPHSQIPWDEDQTYEEIPWWDQPDMDEDDELTALCKKVLLAGGRGQTGNHEIDADRIQSLVIKFVLKVKQRVEERGETWRENNNKI